MLKSVTHNATAWSLFYEILSRSQQPLIPIMTHPCGEQYECLTALPTGDGEIHPSISINLGGSSISVGDTLLQHHDSMTSHQIKQLADKIAVVAGFSLISRRSRAIKGFELYLRIMKTCENLRLCNAWYDGSYNSGLSEEAKAFPAYPLQEMHGASEHMNWWIIVSTKTPIAIFNVLSDQLIMSDGTRYDLVTQFDIVLITIKQVLPESEFVNVVCWTQQLLQDNSEWRERYARYVQTITENTPMIEAVRQSFHEWAPLYLYMNVSNALHAASRVRFELRYLGQTVAEIHHKRELVLSSSKYNALNLRDFGCDITVNDIPWDSPGAAAFRRYFKDKLPTRNEEGRGNHEHRLESLLLTELSKTSSKMLPHMRSVRVGGLRFPMPTPLRASRHMEVLYSGQYGGGIDILARAGFGSSAGLCILELKDETTKQEPPREAVKQALTYAVFIRELLRSEAGQHWWQLFGFGRAVPSSLCLTAVCVMPINGYKDYSFAGLELPIENDTIQLHAVYFTEENNRIVGIESSLAFLNRDVGE